MTYLELCHAALVSSDTGNPGELESLSDANQYHRQVVQFVSEAWKYIQTLHDDWGWRRKEFDFQMLQGVYQYTFSELRKADKSKAVTSLRRWAGAEAPDHKGPTWRISDPANNHSHKGLIARISYEEMRHRKFAANDDYRRPNSFAVYPDLSLVFHPTPDSTYRIYGLYIPGVQILTSENDIPLGLPEEYHDMIKWRAVMMLHASDEARDSYQFASKSFREYLDSLIRPYLPTMTVAGALA